MNRSTYNHYSVRIKRAIIESRNPALFPELKIPRSTAYHWIRRGVPNLEGIFLKTLKHMTLK